MPKSMLNLFAEPSRGGRKLNEDIVGNMDVSNDVRNPNAVRNPKPTYASVVAADAPVGSNANHRREMEKQDRMKKVSFLLFNPVR